VNADFYFAQGYAGQVTRVVFCLLAGGSNSEIPARRGWMFDVSYPAWSLSLQTN